jgi:hypothetical protein
MPGDTQIDAIRRGMAALEQTYYPFEGRLRNGRPIFNIWSIWWKRKDLPTGYPKRCPLAKRKRNKFMKNLFLSGKWSEVTLEWGGMVSRFTKAEWDTLSGKPGGS